MKQLQETFPQQQFRSVGCSFSPGVEKPHMTDDIQGDSCCDDNSERAAKVVVEEDWSDVIRASSAFPGGTNPLGGSGFGRHDCIQDFVLHRSERLDDDGTASNYEVVVVLSVQSVASLSPLDMINLSWGTDDAPTGCSLLLTSWPTVTTRSHLAGTTHHLASVCGQDCGRCHLVGPNTPGASRIATYQLMLSIGSLR